MLNKLCLLIRYLHCLLHCDAVKLLFKLHINLGLNSVAIEMHNTKDMTSSESLAVI